MKGAYVLIIYFNKDRRIKIGKKIIPFQKGFYCYVGSAMNSLDARIAWHKSKKKKNPFHQIGCM